VTPGVSRTRESTWRSFRGRSATNCRSITSPTEELVVCQQRRLAGDGDRLGGGTEFHSHRDFDAVADADGRSPFAQNALNPLESTSTRYSPGCRSLGGKAALFVSDQKLRGVGRDAGDANGGPGKDRAVLSVTVPMIVPNPERTSAGLRRRKILRERKVSSDTIA